MINKSKQGIKLIIGLGNPGKTYENTYHSVGFLFISYLKNNNFPISHLQLLTSQSFMNNSGSFAAKIIKKLGLKPENLLIVHDDSDLALGQYKMQFGRGGAGHHGAESVISFLKTKDFWRLRIGIRPSADARGPARGSARKKAGEFVLKKISAPDKKILTRTFSEIISQL